MIYLLIPLFLFWFIHALRRSLFFFYLFQIKEYRLDRFLEEVKRKKQLIFSNYFYLGLIFLLVWLLTISNKGLSRWVLAFAYLFLSLYSLYLLVKRRWQLPVFTFKMILWSGLALICEIGLFFLLLNHLVLYLVLLEIFLPLFLFLVLRLIQFFVFFAKERVIRRAKAKRAKLNLKVIGITGSYGKTTTKEILYQLLNTKYKVVKTREHVNTEMGVAKTVLNQLDGKTEVFICEMGAYKVGEIKAICDIVKPEMGILTGINEQHLALFGSQENIVKAKYELIENLAKDGVAFFNGENDYCLELYSRTKRSKFLYKMIEDFHVNQYGSIFKFKGVEFETKLLGKHNILNILGAIEVALKLGISIEDCSKVCKELEQKLGGMTLKTGINGLEIIDSSYSSNPDGVISALEYLSLWPGKKAIIIRGLIELGPASKKVHKRIEKKILEVCDSYFTTTAGVFDKIPVVSSAEELLVKLKDIDVLLIEGRVSKKIIHKLI